MTENPPKHNSPLRQEIQDRMIDILQHTGSRERAVEEIREKVMNGLLKNRLSNEPWIHWNPYDQIREGGISYFSEEDGRYVAVYTGKLKFKPRNS
ncbi:MAG: hypothetical protein V1880_04650 [Patescibacteria group bacterium]